MKKIIVAVSALVLGTTAMAQTDQGGWMFGAGSNLGFTSGKADNDAEDATSNLELNARAGYFIIDNLAVGLDVNYGSESTDGVSSASMGVGPYLRYFLMENKLFGEAGFQYQSFSFDGENLGSGSAIGIGAGYAAWLNDNITLEPMVRYQMTSLKPEGADESVKGSNFGVMVNFGIYLGN